MRNMALTVILYFLVMFVQECWYRLAAHFPRKSHTYGEQRASPGVIPLGILLVQEMVWEHLSLLLAMGVLEASQKSLKLVSSPSLRFIGVFFFFFSTFFFLFLFLFLNGFMIFFWRNQRPQSKAGLCSCLGFLPVPCHAFSCLLL